MTDDSEKAGTEKWQGLCKCHECRHTWQEELEVKTVEHGENIFPFPIPCPNCELLTGEAIH